jgi:hypothetical protein
VKTLVIQYDRDEVLISEGTHQSAAAWRWQNRRWTHYPEGSGRGGVPTNTPPKMLDAIKHVIMVSK